MSKQSRVVAGAIAGALVGAAVGYLFFTQRGRELRDRIEPAVDDMKRELARLQKTVEKVSELAVDGVRVVSEFNAARAESPDLDDRTSH